MRQAISEPPSATCPPVGQLCDYMCGRIDADQFEVIAEVCFKQISTITRQNAQLTRARDLLLPRLMDGRIPV